MSFELTDRQSYVTADRLDQAKAGFRAEYLAWKRQSRKAIRATMRSMAEDPIIAGIRDFEDAWDAYLATTDHDAVDAASEAWHRAAWRLVEIEPTTLDGVLALLHVAQLRWPTDGEPVFEGITHPYDPDGNRNWTQEALALIDKALTKLSEHR